MTGCVGTPIIGRPRPPIPRNDVPTTLNRWINRLCLLHNQKQRAHNPIPDTTNNATHTMQPAIEGSRPTSQTH